MTIHMEVQGLAELDRALVRLNNSTTSWKKAIRPALRKALTPVRVQAKAGYAAHQRTGVLFRRLRFSSNRKFSSALVGWQWRSKLNDKLMARHTAAGTKEPFYSRFIEHGFKHRSGASIAGLQYLSDAFDRNDEAAVRVFRDELRKNVDAITRSAGL